MGHNDDERAMATDPLASDDEVMRSFYRPATGNGQTELPGMSAGTAKKPKPTHYKVVSISLYNADLERLDGLVQELRRRGITKMNRSALLRYAIDTVDIDKIPRQY